MFWWHIVHVNTEEMLSFVGTKNQLRWERRVAQGQRMHSAP